MRYSINYRVLIDQIDISNHLSNVQYYEFFKSAFFSFLYQNNFSELVKPRDLWPVVLSESCEFHKEVLFDEEIKIEFHIRDLGEKKNKYWCIGYMFNTQGDKVATYKSLHGLLNRKTRKIEPLSDAAAQLFLNYSL